MIKTEKGKLDIESVYSEFRRARDATKAWREEAQKCFAFLAGDQFKEEDLEALEEDQRPAIEFNQFAIYIETVTGLEQLQSEEVHYTARVAGQPTMGGMSDVLNAAAKYVMNDSDAGMHQSHAFRDLVTCGMGWTETRMDYTTNPDGDIVAADQLDPVNEMYWDPRANKTNLLDARWILRLKKMSREDIEDRWPHKRNKINWDSRFTVPSSWGVETDKRPQEEYKTTPGGKESSDPDMSDEVYVGHLQWYENEPYYRVMTPEGTQVEATKEEWRAFADENPDLAEQADAVLLKRRVYKQAYVVGGTVLEEGPGPCKEDFSIQCMTGKYDRNSNVWYGLGRPLIPPQEWVNKMYSAFIETIATNAKGGGIMIELGSHPNVRELMDNWANPSYIPAFHPGALAGGKVQPKPMPTFPQGIDRLMEIAMGMFMHVSGVNPELLGIVSREQAGVLEYQRKQASMTTLSWAFTAMRNYRRRHGRVLAYFIKKYISDGRLIRVSGQQGETYVPLAQDDLMEYDIVVSTAPSAPNEKDRVFAILKELMPLLAPLGLSPPPEALDYIDLPAQFVEAWKKRLSEPDPMMEQAKQLDIAKRQAEVQKMQSDAQLNDVKAQAEMARAGTEQMKGQIEAQKLEFEKIRLGHEAQMMEQKQWIERVNAMQKQASNEMQMRVQEIKAASEQQKAIMDIMAKDIDNRHMQEQFMISMADRQDKHKLDMEAKLADVEARTQAQAEELYGKQLKSFKTLVKNLLKESNVDYTDEEEEMNREFMVQVTGILNRVADEVSDLRRKVEASDGEGKDQKIVMAETLDIIRMLSSEVENLKSATSGPSGPVLGDGTDAESMDIQRDDTGRISMVGKRRIVRDEDGMIVRVE